MKNYSIKNKFSLVSSFFCFILGMFYYVLNVQGAIIEGVPNKLIEANLPFTMPHLIENLDGYYVIIKFPVTPGQKYTLDINYPPQKNTGRDIIIYGLDPSTMSKGNRPISAKYGKFFTTFNSGFMWPCDPPPRCWLTKRYNIYISHNSSGKFLYVVIKSKTPGLKNTVLLNYPGMSDSMVQSRIEYPLCPPRNKYYCGKYGTKFFWGTIIKNFLLLNSPILSTKEEQKYSPLQSETLKYVEGKWEFDAHGEKRILDIKQSGNIVYGYLFYPEGTAIVNGEIKGKKVVLTVTYNDPALIAKWVPWEISKQAVGVKSVFKLMPSADPRKMEGVFYSWYLYWDTNKKLTKKYNALQVGNPNNDKPYHYILIKKDLSPYSSYPVQTGIFIEAEDELSTNVKLSGSEVSWHSKKLSILPHSGKGYWYLSRGGDWLLYVFNVPSDGNYKLWVKDLNDRKHPHRARTIVVKIDSEKEFKVPANTSPGSYGWGWHLIGTVHLVKGKHIMKIVKESTTSAAAVLDAFYITQGEEHPPM